MRRERRSARMLAALALAELVTASPVSAADVAASNAAKPAAGEARGRGQLAPAAERSVQGPPRTTLATRAAQRDRAKKRAELGTQIPAALRERVLARVEARITRNLDQARRLRAEALELLGRLLAELPEDAPELPPTLMRLGELEWEEARERFLAEFERWERTPTDLRKAPPSPDYSRARAHFRRVIERHPGCARYDLALYVSGFLAMEEGKTEDALVDFNRILAEHPESAFVPDAHMVRAEAEFARPSPDYQLARAEYEAVLAHPATELHDLALFKSAWALWRLGQTEEAARRFLAVFKSGADRAAAVRSRERRAELEELQAEALKNLVAVFIEDEKNTADDMYALLVKAGGERFAGEVVRALAEALYEQAHYTRGIEAYRLLIKLEPTADDAYEHALAIARAYSTLELWSELREEYASLLALYVGPPKTAAAPGPDLPGGAPAPRAQAAAPPQPTTASAGAWLAVHDAATRERAERAILAQLHAEALGLHAKAQRDQTSRVEFETAAGLYELFLSRFAAKPEAYEVQFNLGEIHFHRLGNALAAADAYLAAVRLRPDGPWSRDALYNALSALETAREAEFQQGKARGEAARESPLDAKLTEAMELYSRTYPEDRELPELLYRQGRLYYDYGVYDVAVRQWGLLLERHGTSERARAAGELVLDSFNRSADYQNIEVWGRRLLSAPAFASADSQAKLTTLIVQAIFKQGEQLSASREHALAARAYARAAREFPKDGRAAQAAVNATLEAERALDLPLMREAAALLVERFADRPEAARGVWAAAKFHESIGLLSEAAAYHEQHAKLWPKSEQHADAAYNAVLLRTTLGERERAIDAGQSFQRRYPSGALSDEVTFLMGKAHEQARDYRAAEALYARYAASAKNPSRRIEARVRLAEARVALGDEAGAKDALESAVQSHKASLSALDERGKYFGARAHFMRAERTLAEFSRIRIEGDVARLAERLKRKADLLKRASTAFLDTAKLGVAEWTTASLYQIGAMYEAFAAALSSSPPPPSLTAEQAEAYRMQIDEFVVPIEEKSLEAYESGWKKALELGIFNAWTAKMRQALGRLNAELYPPLSEIGFRLRSEASGRLPELIAAPRRTGAGTSADYLLAPAPVDGAGPLAKAKTGSTP